VTIRGSVEGDVVTFAGTATLGRRAQVGGDLLYLDEKPVVTPGAQVDGKTKRFSGELGGVVACITIVGLPFGIGLLLALLPLLGIAYVTTAFVIGRKILKDSRIPALLVGLLILRVLALIPIAGGLIGLLAMIFGLGVLVVTLLRSRS